MWTFLWFSFRFWSLISSYGAWDAIFRMDINRPTSRILHGIKTRNKEEFWNKKVMKHEGFSWDVCIWRRPEVCWESLDSCAVVCILTISAVCWLSSHWSPQSDQPTSPPPSLSILQSSPPHTLLTWPSPLYDERRELPLIWPLQWVGSQVTGLDRRQTIVFHIQRVRILILVRQERRQEESLLEQWATVHCEVCLPLLVEGSAIGWPKQSIFVFSTLWGKTNLHE